MKHKVSELEGALLDAAVAKAEGWAYRIGRDGSLRVDGVSAERSGPDFAPSTDWEQAGMIIERERISLSFKHRRHPYENGSGDWCAHVFIAGSNMLIPGSYLSDQSSGEKEGAHLLFSADSPLIAAMRAYVTSKFGEEVDL